MVVRWSHRKWLVWLVAWCFFSTLLAHDPGPARAKPLTPAPRPELTALSPVYKVADLGGDLEAVFRFAADEITYQSYQGVLRGARGALMSLSGNAFDQALLLAAMIKALGMEYRFAFGRLDPERAGQLATQILTVPAISQEERLSLALMGNLDPFLIDNFAARVEADYEDVSTALTKAGITFKPDGGAELARMTGIARDHVWLQMKRDGKWLDLDPSFNGAGIGQSFCPAASTAADIPADKRHRVTIKLEVEEKEGGALKRWTALEYSADSAQLVGRSLVLHQEHSSGTGGLFQAAAGVKAVTPLLYIDETEIKGKQIDIATGKGLSSLMDEGPKKELTAQWLVFTFHSPDGGIKMVRRAVFDRIGYTARRTGDAAQAQVRPMEPHALATIYGMAVVSGGIPAQYFTAKAYRFRSGSYFRVVSRSVAMLTHAYSYLRRVIPPLFFEDQGVGSYIDAPNLTICRLKETERAESRSHVALSLDLARKAYRTANNGSEVAVGYERVLAGVLDANIERYLVERMAMTESGADVDAAGASQSNIGLVMEKTWTEGVALTVLTDPAAPRLAELDYPAEAGQRLTDDLARGGAAVAPMAAVQSGRDQTMVGWWLVDPITGYTTDVMGDGRHSAASEKAQLEKDNAKKMEMQRRKRCLLAAILYTAAVVVIIGVFPLAIAAGGAGGPGMGPGGGGGISPGGITDWTDDDLPDPFDKCKKKGGRRRNPRRPTGPKIPPKQAKPPHGRPSTKPPWSQGKGHRPGRKYTEIYLIPTPHGTEYRVAAPLRPPVKGVERGWEDRS